MVDIMITLFDSQSIVFTTNGLGTLSDAISCTVTEENNGEFELELEYPITGMHYKELSLRKIIYTKPNPHADPQPFRIYAMSKVINGIVTVNASHISYDASGYPVSPFSATSIQLALLNIKDASVMPCPFTFFSDKIDTGNMVISKPTSIRSILGAEILDTYGGEYEFDKFDVRLLARRGMDRGVSIRYGKNLTDLRQEENCNSVYTGVYPFWYSESVGVIQLSEKILNASGTYDFVKIYPLDLSSTWSDPPTEEQLRSEGTLFMTKNEIGIPKVSITVSFTQLSKSEEYKKFSILETVYIGDSVNVEFPELGVSAVARCVKTSYNAVTNKYNEIELGEASSNIATTITDVKKEAKDNIANAKSALQLAIEDATAQINNALGGYVIKRNGELLIMDTEDILTAVKVWRWNVNGLGYSGTGYNGPFTTAMTANGKINADMITVGTLNAGLARIANINASEINTGILNANLISAGTLNASLITAGVLNGNLAKITNIDASEINTGVLNANLITAGILKGIKIEQISDSGVLLAELYKNANGGLIHIYDIYGQLNAKLGSENGSAGNVGGTLILYNDSIYMPRVELGISSAYGSGTMNLKDISGNVRVAAYANSNIGPMIGVLNSSQSAVSYLTETYGRINGNDILHAGNYSNYMGNYATWSAISDMATTSYVDSQLGGLWQLCLQTFVTTP